MNAITPLIDFWNTVFLNIWNMYRTHGGIYFYITVAIVVVFPILKRIVRAIRGGR